MKSSDFTRVLSLCWLFRTVLPRDVVTFLFLFSFLLGGSFPQDVDSIFFYFRNNFLTHIFKCLLFLIIMVFFFRDSFYMYVGFIFVCNTLYNFSLILFDSLSISIYLACIYHFNPCYFLVLSVLSLPLYYFKFLLHFYVAFTFLCCNIWLSPGSLQCISCSCLTNLTLTPCISAVHNCFKKVIAMHYI